MKLFLGPVSLNTIDSTIEFAEEYNLELGFIPSRRQIDYDGGYVGDFNSKTFSEYVRLKTNKVKIFRDHGGEDQGKSTNEDTFISFYNDTKYFDFIHLDPFLKYKDLDKAAIKTVEYLQFCEFVNPNLYYEIATEQALREISPEELGVFVEKIKLLLTETQFNKIKYLVIQCGTKLKDGKNTGEYDKEKLLKMLKVAKKFNLISKEHNGDYQSTEIIKEKFSLGLDCINIAPEFGIIESTIILKYLDENAKNILFQMCFDSGKWKKWVSQEFKPKENKEDLIKICCHYIFSNESFKEFKKKYLPLEIDTEIKATIKNRIKDILL
jgi:hypothetical protein